MELETNEKKGRKPDYKGNLELAAWINKDKNGKQYISVKLGTSANLFKNEKKEQNKILDN